MFTIHDNKIDMVLNKMPNNLYTIKETRIQNIIKDHHVSPVSKTYSLLAERKQKIRKKEKEIGVRCEGGCSLLILT